MTTSILGLDNTFTISLGVIASPMANIKANNEFCITFIVPNISDEDGLNSSMTDVFGVAGTGIELIPPRQIMGRLSYNF